MVFSSHLFCFYFLPFALGAYFLAPRGARNLMLALLSYLFYGWANPAFLALMLFSTCVDYACGLALGREESESRRKLWLLLSVGSNLTLLGFFKYFNLAADTLAAWVEAADRVGVDLSALAPDLALRVTLPLGISFYTFQSMSYTIDVYRRRVAPLRSFVDFACFVSMFPQLVAGPIVRFKEVAEQLQERSHSLARAARGLALFSLGMGKKVLIANPCGQLADATFGAASVSTLDAWVGALAYAFQIYFDFSGYSDMALGLGLLFGFSLPRNFDSPYRSRSFAEFWQRWHMSLSRWLRDYLYIPLGGNRLGSRKTYRNLLLVMLLGGLWHGAAWNFVVWGAYHGLLLAGERALGRESVWGRLPGPLRNAGVFLAVLVGWVFFRASDLPAAGRYLASMAGLGGSTPQEALLGGLLYRPYFLFILAVAISITWGAPRAGRFLHRSTPAKMGFCALVLAVSLVLMETQGYNPFIYFIF